MGTCKNMIVAEMNRGQIYREVLRVARGRWEVGKVLEEYGGMMTPEAIVSKVREVTA